jgi:hypothetical protein
MIDHQPLVARPSAWPSAAEAEAEAMEELELGFGGKRYGVRFGRKRGKDMAGKYGGKSPLPPARHSLATKQRIQHPLSYHPPQEKEVAVPTTTFQ